MGYQMVDGFACKMVESSIRLTKASSSVWEGAFLHAKKKNLKKSFKYF
jgi:hypothetical protein